MVGGDRILSNPDLPLLLEILFGLQGRPSGLRPFVKSSFGSRKEVTSLGLQDQGSGSTGPLGGSWSSGLTLSRTEVTRA